MDALYAAAGGMGQAMGRLDAIASQVAGVGSLDDQVQASDVAGMISAKTDFEANVKVLETANRMLGSLLDIKT
jgi:flagellar basal body rod protein FlgG